MNNLRAPPRRQIRVLGSRSVTTARQAVSGLFRGLVLLHAACFGSIASGHGDPNEKLAILDTKIENEANPLPHLLERSEIHRRHRHYDRAIDDLKRALAISPTNQRVHYHLGLNHLDKGDFASAETALRRYVEAVPRSPTGHVALARALARQDRHVAAAREYELAIAAQPTPVPDHYLARARAYRAAGEPYLDRAIKGLDEAMRELGPLITLRKLAIDIELARGNPAGAIDRIDDVLAGARRKETWLVRKGGILADIGRHDEAFAAFSSAREALDSLPARIRSSPAMATLDQTVSIFLDKDTQP